MLHNTICRHMRKKGARKRLPASAHLRLEPPTSVRICAATFKHLQHNCRLDLLMKLNCLGIHSSHIVPV
jgi:hypothetical protein